MLADNADGTAATNKTTPKTIVTDVRLYFPLAVNADTIISYKLNDDVKTANKNKIKNKAKNNDPSGSSPNAAGNVINNKGGPSAGSKPSANTTGNIARPANNETKIFIDTTEPAEVVKLTLRFK